MSDGLAKLRAIGPVPGVDGIEGFELRSTSAFLNANEFDAGVDDRASAIGKANQWENRPRGPDFGVIGASRFERRQREYHVADRAGTNEQSPHFNLYRARALSRKTMRASSDARSRLISLSRSIPVRAIASAWRLVVAAT